MKKQISFFFLFLCLLISTNKCSGQWVQNYSGLNILNFTHNGGYIYAAKREPDFGIYRSTNGGLNWEYISSNPSWPISLATFAGNIFVGTYNNGVYWSSNNGVNWNQTSLNNQRIHDIEVDSINSRMYAATYFSGVLISTNNGFNWSQSSLLDTVNVVTTKNNIVYAGKFLRGLSISTNYGNNWTQSYINNFSVFAIGASGNYVYLGRYDYPSTTGGIYISSNNGANFSQGTIPNGVNAITAFDNYVFAGTTVGEVYLSTNYGSTWTLRNEGLIGQPQRIYSLYIYGSKMLLGTENIGIWSRNISELITGLNSPTLISPSNNSTEISLTPTLVWNTVSGATGYKVKISMDSTFTTLTDSSTVTTNQYSIPSGKLSYNQKYYWKIAGYNAYGVGQYSIVWSFTTLNPLPLQVTLLSPSNGSSNVTLTPTLFWNTSTNSTNYRVQVSPSNTFSYIVDSATVSTNQRTIPSGKLNIATTYYWRVQGINSFGNGPWSTVWSFFTVITGVNQLGTEIPKEYFVGNNYPNPFNPTTRIKYGLPKEGNVKLVIYDMLGKEVKTIINETQKPGVYEATFDASSFPSGVYFYRIVTNDFVQTRRMVLVK